MNLNKNPNPDQLADLLRSCNDEASNHVLWVNKDGAVQFSPVTNGIAREAFKSDHPEMKVCFDPFLAGNEYVGPEAANDAEWIAELWQRLLTEWSVAQGKQEVAFVDGF